MTAITSKGQIDQLMAHIRSLSEAWTHMEIIDLSAYCDCGESALNSSWPAIEYFLRCHTDRGHRAKVDFLIRFRAEVIHASQCWTKATAAEKKTWEPGPRPALQ